MEGACPSARIGGIRQGPGVRRGVTGKLIFRAGSGRRVGWLGQVLPLLGESGIKTPIASSTCSNITLQGCGEAGREGAEWVGSQVGSRLRESCL